MNVEKSLLLHHTEGLGAVTFHKLLQEFTTAEAVFGANDRELMAAGIPQKVVRAMRKTSDAQIEADLKWAQDERHHIICWGDPLYPKRLMTLPDAPPILFIKGNASLLNDPQIAIVGSRNATPGGKNIAYEFAQELAKVGLLVSSGMAQGIDAFAHLGALDAEAPSLAVIATGQDIIYPAKNKELAHRIADKGVIVSEFSYGTPPNAANFPRRNRIISGLALGVLVVEAKIRSGALITARLANEQGREVFAIPGSIKNHLSKGCHYLLRDGAVLVEDVTDILKEIKSAIEGEHLKPLPDSDTQEDDATPPHENLSKSHFQLLDEMGYDPVTSDELAESTGKPIGEIASMLLMLELENYISNSGGMYCRIR